MATKKERDEKLAALKDDYDISDDDWSALQDAFAGAGLRETNRQLSEQLNEFKDKAGKWDAHTKQQAAEERFKAANVDWDALRPLERSQVSAALDDIGDDQAELEKFIADNALPVLEGGQGSGEEEGSEASNVREFSRQSRGSAARVASVSPKDTEQWSAERWAEFEQKHPEEAEQVLQGKTVNVPG